MESAALAQAQIPPQSSWCDYATVSVKFKCKYCEYETEDLPTLKAHCEQTHTNGHGQQTINPVATNSIDGGEGQIQSQAQAPSAEPAVPLAQAQRTQILPPHKFEAGVLSPSSEIYLCSECNVTFESEALCFEHMSFEHGLEEFNENITSDESRLETKSLPSPPPFPRPKRKTRAPNLLTLEGGGVVVPKKYRKDSKTKCNLCKAKFEQEEILQIHQQCHNRKDSSSVQEKDLNGNQDPHPKKVLGYSCILCKLASTAAATMPATENNESDADGKNFSKWGQCAIHLWRRHNIDCELYQCLKCPFKAYAKATLEEHANSHGIVSKFKCQTCHKAFKQLSQLKNHGKYHKEKSTKLPPPGEERWYTPKICPVCGRVLSDQKCLKRHISYVHNKLKQHVCNVCGHMSARKAELQLHMRQHTGERPYKCPFCTFTTIDRSSLRRHKFRHTQNYTYSCAHCDYKCIQTNAFKVHMKTTHPGKEGIFKCSLCAFESVNSILFEAHLKKHNDNEGRAGANTSSIEAIFNDSSSADSTCHNDNDNATDFMINEDEGMPEPSRRQISVRAQSWLQEDSDNDNDSGDENEDSSGGLEGHTADTGGITIPAPAAPASSTQETLTNDQ